ncbi:MAG: S8 family serine peptidase [Bryobacterales bacterium]|nr:S8 family serine peptidase [Bryobacterales bacterium]
MSRTLLLVTAACTLATTAFGQLPGTVPGVYIVELKEEPAARYAMKTRSAFSARRAAMQSRRSAVRASQMAFRRSASIPDKQVVHTMDTVVNALVLQIPGSEAKRLSTNPDVRKVYPVHEMTFTMDKALPLLNVPAVWQAIGGSSNAGAGVKIAIIDTGIDETHPAFQAPSLSLPAGFPKYDNVADIGQTNRKVIVARNYTAALHPAAVDLEDQVGHGTAVAMVAAGMPVQGPEGTTISGVAPGAWLGSYKVGVPGQGPANTSGISRSDVALKAIDDAIADGMDVINLSMSVEAAWLVPPEEFELYDVAARHASAMGVLMIVGAANDGPERLTIGSSPSYYNLLVGGSNNSRLLGGTAVLTDNSSYVAVPPVPPYALPSGPVSGVLGIVDDIDPAGHGCLPLPAGSLAGRIALLHATATCTFQTMLGAARDAGASGAVIYLEGYQDPPLYGTGDVNLPSVSIGFADGQAIANKVHSSPGLSATLNLARNSTPVNSNRVADLSSRGPDSNYLIRPDLLAVANYIYAASPGNRFIFQSGTSFASPMVAGGAAILRAARPGLTVDQYFSLLVNSATQLMPDGQHLAPVMEQGAGRMNLDAALKTTLAAVPRSLSFGPGAASVNKTMSVSLVNLGPSADTLQLSIQSIDGLVTPSLSAASVPLASGQSASVSLTLAAGSLASGEYQGYVRVRSTATNSEMHIPYWYGVASSTPKFVKVAVGNPAPAAGSAQSSLFWFRITDAIGIPIRATPAVQVVSGGAAGPQVYKLDTYRDLFVGAATPNSTPGNSLFRITLAGLTRDVLINFPAAAPKAVVSQPYFGDVLAGSSRDATVTITNGGSGTLNVTSLSTTDPQFQVLNSASGFSLAPNTSQMVTVRFSPVQLGLQAASLIVAGNDTSLPSQSFRLRGYGISPAGPMQVSNDNNFAAYSWGFPSGTSTAYFVSRITPPKYPAVLQSIEIYFGDRSDGLQVGTPLTLVAAANPSGSQNINGASFQTTGGTIGKLGSFNTFPAPGITLNSGDFLIGMMVNNPANTYPADTDTTTPALPRFYTSSNGATFSQEPAAAGNFLIRATVTYPGGCTFQITRTSASVAPDGDNGRIPVNASSPFCAWSAQSTTPWITLAAGGQGQGRGALAFTAAANPTAASRSGVISLAGTTIYVYQPPPGCSFTLSTQSLAVPAAGGASSVTVNATPSCSWTPTAQPSWTTLTSGAATGTANASLSSSANPANSARTGSLEIAGLLTQLLQPAANPLQIFQDVPLSNPFSPYIGLMKDNAVTSGCTTTTYCPDTTTTRGQMAVFIVRALMGDSFDYQPGPYFTDVPASHPFFKYIQKMRQLGVTSGCTATTYCPDAPVTRGQMAVFIVRARLALQPGAALFFPNSAFFTDVPASHPFFSFIQKMRQLGVTSGCSASAYCPDDPTTRGQMAVFIMRGLLTP